MSDDRQFSLLLAEDDSAFADRLCRNLKLAQFDAETVANGREALERLKARPYDLLVTDIRMPELGGLDLIRAIKAGNTDGVDPDMPIVVLTSVAAVDTAVEAMRLGASDYITKEAEKQEIVLRLRKVLEQSELAVENRILRGELERRDEFRDLIGESPVIEGIKEDIAQIAGSDVTVLITGETGSGKELVARAIHRTGPQTRGPFIDVNCAALPDDNMFQSELFGHERGAFTGAHSLRKGRFELAHRGTLFLDEIAELGRESQGKILKALEQREITRLGGTRPVRVDCRLVFATNKDLMEEMRAGRFREDLYYRVNVFPIHVPPLRERRGDIRPLARFFADQFARKLNRQSFFFEESAMAILRDYPYPGNIRELRNIIERLVIRARGDVITREQVEQVGLHAQPGQPAVPQPAAPTSTAPHTAPLSAPASLGDSGMGLEEIERQLVIEALDRTGWNQKDAAALLNISVDRMNARVRKFGLKHPKWRVHK